MRPNFLFLFPDSHRGDWLPYSAETYQAMGIDAPLPIRLPNLEKLMERGTTFTRAITSSPLCAPARASLATGLRYPLSGVISNKHDLPLQRKTYYSVLKENGYTVCGVGKFDLHKKTRWWGLDGWIPELEQLGFTMAIDNAGKQDAVSTGKESPQDPYMKYLYDQGVAAVHLTDMAGRSKENRHNTEPTPLPEEAYCDNWITRNGVQMLRTFPQDQRWFMIVNFTGPHGPWDVTERMRKAWDSVDFPPPHRSDPAMNETYNRVRQNYAAMLENIDRNVGLLLDEVKKRGELENTVVIYVSDHGDMLGDNRRFNKSIPDRGSIHIPLVISGPGISQGALSDALVELQDLAGTIVDFAGVNMPEAADSCLLRPLLEGDKQTHREVQMSALDRTDDGRGSWRAIIDRQYKLVVRSDSESLLYDIVQDPWEDHDIAGQYPDVVLRMQSQLGSE
jgi:arylsulfatase A-like enzyme